MQTALDSTALMLSKEAATDSEDQLNTNALKYFTAIFVKPEAKDIQVHVAYTTDGGSKIVITANASMPADFTKILGYDTFNLVASSTAKWGTNRLRVALVLDNTGSMSPERWPRCRRQLTACSLSCRAPLPPRATSMFQSSPS